MTLRKLTVDYKWTTRDHTNARTQPTKPPPKTAREWDEEIERRQVTPYGILPEYFPACQKYAPGSMVKIPLELSFLQPWRVERFFYRDDLVWKPVPSEAAACATLGDLCDKMYALSQDAKYEDLYGRLYEDVKKNDKAKSDFAMMLFDHWKNTEYRWDVVEHGFDWTLRQTPQKIAARGPSLPIKLVPTHPPKERVIGVVPGNQAICLEDPNLDTLMPDIKEIENVVGRIRELLRQADKLMHDRMVLAHGFTALRTLFEVSAGTGRPGSDKAADLAGKAGALETKTRKAARETPVREILSEHSVPPELEKVLRKEFGLVDDIAAEVQRLSQRLVDKLLKDKQFADRCGTWAKYVLKHKLEATPGVLTKSDRLTAAAEDAMLVLLETPPGTEAGDALFDILMKLPEDPPLDHEKFAAGDGALQALISWAGITSKTRASAIAQIATSAIGNAAGPPSLWVASIQAWTFWQVRGAMGKAAKLAELQKILGDGSTLLGRTLGQDANLRARLEQALKSGDKTNLHDTATEYLGRVTQNTMASKVWKTGVVAFQLFALIMAYAQWKSDTEDAAIDPRKHGVAMADFIGMGTQTVMFGAALADALSSWLNLTRLAGLASQLGLLMGGISGIFGVVTAIIQLGDPYNTMDRIDKAIAIANLVGNALVGMASLFWLAGVALPGINLLGVGIIFIAFIAAALKANADASKPPVNKLALAVVAELKKNPFLSAMTESNDFNDKLSAMVQSLMDDPLPSLSNNQFTFDRLQVVGFTTGEIQSAIDKGSGALLTPAPLAQPASPVPAFN